MDRIQNCLRDLKSDNHFTRIHAILELKEIGTPSEVPALIELLHALKGEKFSYNVFDETALTIASIINRNPQRDWSPEVADLMAFIEDAPVTRVLTEALGQLDELVLPHLFKTMEHERSSVRHVSAEALGETRNPKIVPYMITALDDEDEEVRRAAALALANVGGEEATQALLTALWENERARESAAAALAKLGDPETLPSLIDAVKYPDARAPFCIALKKIGDLSAVDALRSVLMDGDQTDCKYAIEALESLIRKYPNHDWSVMVRGLARVLMFQDYASKRAARILDGMCHCQLNTDEKVMCLLYNEKIEMVAELGVSALPQLIRCLKHSRVLRSEAAYALGFVGDPSAIPYLKKSLKRGNEKTRMRSIFALEKIGGDASLQPLADALKDPSAEVRKYAAEKLASYKDQISVLALIDALNDAEPRVVRSACDSLALIGDRTAVPALIALLNTGGEGSWDAAEALGFLGDPSAVPALANAIKKTIETPLRNFFYTYFVALKRIKHESAAPVFLHLLENDSDPQTRIDALFALEEIQGISAVDTLIASMGDGDKAVRSASVAILSKVIHDCSVMRDVELIEAKAKAFYATALGNVKDVDERIELNMNIANLRKNITGQKNKLTQEKGLILKTRPKPPKKGRMYQAVRRVRNG